MAEATAMMVEVRMLMVVMSANWLVVGIECRLLNSEC
jgi:hypothetical protein